MRLAYGSAQPTLTRAREQARKHGYPYFILVTTTPNGTVGTGEWFYDMWDKATDSETIFDDNSHLIEDADTYVNDPVKNGFVKVRFHWSEDSGKDDAWYLEQKRDLNFDTRMINQELDLIFVGSTNCLFSDDYLIQLKSQKPIDKIKLPHGCHFNLFTHRQNFDKTDYYLIGCDTAKSFVGDYNALEMFTYSNFIQIGEFFGRLGSLTKYSEVLMHLVKTLAPIVQNRLILCIENNSFGATIIENLENATDFDYMQFVYSPQPDKWVGINTNAKTKSLMVSILYDLISDDPLNVKSTELISELNIIERRVNGSIGAQRGYHDDLFMAAALCAYTKRLSSTEYDSLLGVSTILQQQQNAKKLSSMIAVANKSITGSLPIEIKQNTEEGGLEYVIYPEHEDTSDDLDVFAFL